MNLVEFWPYLQWALIMLGGCFLSAIVIAALFVACCNCSEPEEVSKAIFRKSDRDCDESG